MDIFPAKYVTKCVCVCALARAFIVWLRIVRSFRTNLLLFFIVSVVCHVCRVRTVVCEHRALIHFATYLRVGLFGLQFGQYTVIVFICRGGSAESAFDASDVVRRVYLFCVYVRQAYHLYSGGHRNRNQLVLSAAATIDAPKTHNSQAII